jgi:hypothetical protein
VSASCYAECGREAINKWREKPWCGRAACRSEINHRLWMEQCQERGKVKGKKIRQRHAPPKEAQ